MRVGIKAKQVLGVTSIVVAVVVILSLMHLATLAQVRLEESRARAELLANAILHRARDVVTQSVEAYEALRADPGLRSILQSQAYANNVMFAAIADVDDIAVAHADTSLEGQPIPSGQDLAALLSRPALSQLIAIYTGPGRNLEYTQPLLLGDRKFGSIRIGVSTLLIRDDLSKSVGPAAVTAVIAAGVAVLLATLFAQLLLRPIHVIRSGLTRLGRGEFGVRLDLDQNDEFGELGTFFNAVSAQLSADRSHMAGQVASLESAVEHLEDAVAMVSPRGELLFANPAMRAILPNATPGVALSDIVPPDHAVRRLAEQTLGTRQSLGPISATFAEKGARGGTAADDKGTGERLIITHAVSDPAGQLVGGMIIARNVAYLGQVQSTLRYSRKLVALGRLSVGVAHEVKNPLNAMMIHLELLRQQFTGKPAPTRAGAGDGRAVAVASEPQPIDSTKALQHVDVIAGEIRRLDEVVQGFLKFTRPEELKLQPVRLKPLFDEVVPIVQPEATRTAVTLDVDCNGVPDVNGDPAMLRQAFLNLALNACQAMPGGGTLRVTCEAARDRRVAISFSDTGIGIKPEHLSRIFDLYFTTKQQGSGIGLSMVYRTIQMHDGEIEVESTPGTGTTFRMFLPQA
jgi:signal transduction histidine kinase/PAS domain-containing protein